MGSMKYELERPNYSPVEFKYTLWSMNTSTLKMNLQKT